MNKTVKLPLGHMVKTWFLGYEAGIKSGKKFAIQNNVKIMSYETMNFIDKTMSEIKEYLVKLSEGERKNAIEIFSTAIKDLQVGRADL